MQATVFQGVCCGQGLPCGPFSTAETLVALSTMTETGGILSSHWKRESPHERWWMIETPNQCGLVKADRLTPAVECVFCPEQVPSILEEAKTY